jgi:hypothetical protein
MTLHIQKHTQKIAPITEGNQTKREKKEEIFSSLRIPGEVQ